MGIFLLPVFGASGLLFCVQGCFSFSCCSFLSLEGDMTLPGKKVLKTLFFILLWKILNTQKQREWSCEWPTYSWPSTHSYQHFPILNHPWSSLLPSSLPFFFFFPENFKANPQTSYFTCYVKPLGEGNGTPLQYSCLENPMDGVAW